MSDLARLQRIFREFFDDDGLVISPGTQAEDIAGWDSVAHVGLLAAIEQDCGLEFDLDEILALTSVEALLAAIARGRGAG